MGFSPTNQVEEDEFFDYNPVEKQQLDANDEFLDYNPVKSKAPLPKAPPKFSEYLGITGDIARNILSKNDKKSAGETIKRRLQAGEKSDVIFKELDEAGWTPEEQGELLSSIFGEPEPEEKKQTLTIEQALSDPDKRKLLQLTPKQVEEMTPAQQEYMSEKMQQIGEEEGSQALINGLLFGVPDWLREKAGVETPDFVDPRMKGVAEMMGSLPFYAFGNSALINPLISYVKGGKFVSGLISVLGNAGLMSTEQTVKRLIKEGDIPKLKEYTGYLADIVVLEGALGAAGKLPAFKDKLKEFAKKKGLTPENALRKMFDKDMTALVKESPQKAAEQLLLEMDEAAVKPFDKPEAAKKLEKTIEGNRIKDKVESKVEVKGEPKAEAKVEGKTVTASKKLPLSAKKPKELAPEKTKATAAKKPKPPVHVDIPPEDIGKPAAEIVGQHVQSHAVKPDTPKPKLRQVRDWLERKFYNQYAPLKRLGEGEASIMNKPRELAELVKGATSTAESVLKYGQYDVETGMLNGPGFSQIFAKDRLKNLTGKKKLDRQLFDSYLASRSSLERQALGHESPIPTKAAESLIRSHPEYEALAKDLTNFSKNDVINLRKEGLLSKEGEDAMFDMYKNFAPLYRAMPEELTLAEQVLGKEAGDVLNFTKEGKIKSFNPLKRTKGGDANLKILSPTESFVKNTIATQKAIAKNQTMKAVGKGLEKQGFEAKRVNGPKRTQKELQELLGPDYPVSPDMVDKLNEALGTLNPEAAKGSIRWYENGHLMEIRGVPKEITEALDGLTPQMGNKVVELIGKANHMFSAGVVLQPATMAKLGFMDMLVSTLQSKHMRFTGAISGLAELPTRVMYDYPRMFFELLKKGDLFQKYMQSGAAQSALRGLDRQMLSSMTDTFVNAAKNNDPLLRSTLRTIGEGVKAPFKILSKISEGLSDIPRMLEFERSVEASLKKGLSYPEALKQGAFDAFEVSVPYGRKGSSSTLNFLYKVPLMGRFMNTIINSGVSFAKALDPRNPMGKTVWATGMAYLTAPTISEYLKNRNDPRYQALTQEVRDANIIHYSTDDPDEQPLKIRKMWQFGWLFQTLPEHLIEFAIQQDPKALEGLVQSFESEFSPLSGLSFVQAFSGGKFDYEKLKQGRYSLVPERQKKIEAELQHTQNTSETAKKLAQYIKLSPIYIDWLVNQTGGGLGKDVLRLADEAMYQTGSAVDRRPELQAADSIFWGTFWGRGPSKSNAYANKFYEYVDEMESKKATAKELRRQGREDEADKVMEGYQDITWMRTALGKRIKAVDDIFYAHPKDLNGVEKRKELTALYREMTQLAKEYVEQIEANKAIK